MDIVLSGWERPDDDRVLDALSTGKKGRPGKSITLEEFRLRQAQGEVGRDKKDSL